MLIIAGFIFIVIGSLITGLKVDRILKTQIKGIPFLEKIFSNIGIILFVIGVICILTGIVNLYYG